MPFTNLSQSASITNFGEDSDGSKCEVGLLDITEFISQYILKRKGKTKHSKIVAKVDVEGVEYDIFPKLLVTNTLCRLSTLLIEWHGFGNDEKIIKTFPETLKWIVKNTATKCPVELIDMDDETFGFDELKVDYPTPVFTLE